MEPTERKFVLGSQNPGKGTYEEYQLRLRAGVHAGMFPTNYQVDDSSRLIPDEFPPGWTAQEPWAHVKSAVPLICIFCWGELDIRQWTRHTCNLSEIYKTGKVHHGAK